MGDVMYFDVHDKESGKHIASFYLDPYSRPADKRPGAWMDVCIGKSDACDRNVPVAYLTCNGSPPVGDKPSLMTFREAETLFHEAGHGLQHMLTRASVGDVAGINGVDWDAVELPSQFMENWLYDEPTLYGFAKHYETGEPLPKEMFEKLKMQKTYGARWILSCIPTLMPRPTRPAASPSSMSSNGLPRNTPRTTCPSTRIDSSVPSLISLPEDTPRAITRTSGQR